MTQSPFLANDRYRATLRANWVNDPVDTALLVSSVPDNVPTIVVVGWRTEFETVFSVEGKSGTSYSTYALTGLTWLRGYDGIIPENTAVNCLNNEEFINQYAEGAGGALLNMDGGKPDSTYGDLGPIDAGGV
jgi:hypothetical protein